MSTNASRIRDQWTIAIASTQGAVAVGDLRQMTNGQAGIFTGTAGLDALSASGWTTQGQYTLPKQTGIVLLDGGRAYFDRSAGVITYKRNGDQDYYVGRVVGDAASAEGTCAVNLNVDPKYDFELSRDPLACVPVGTKALGGFLPVQAFGGATKYVLDTTNEAQKVDALGYEGAIAAANHVVEMLVNVISVGTGGAQDFNVGLASGTHATDFDSITEHLAVHVDGNSLVINVQSKDGTHTTSATTIGSSLTAGTPFEIWLDCRNPAAVKVYLNGVVCSPSPDISSSTSALKLIAHLEKTAAANAFEADVYFLRSRIAEQ